MASYISVQFVKDNAPYLDLSHYSDTTVSGMISRASDMVNNFTDRDFEFSTVTNEKADTVIDNWGNIVISPRKAPIVPDSITSLNVVYGTTEVNLTVESSGEPVYDVPDPYWRVIYPNESVLLMTGPTVIDLPSLRELETYTEISYTGGYQDVPGDIQEATLLFLLDMFSKRQNMSGAESVTQGAITVSYGSRSGKSDFALDAETILMKYKRIT